LNYDFDISRTPNKSHSSSRTADKLPFRSQIIRGVVVDDDSDDEIIELTDSSVELTPLKGKNFNYKLDLGERNSSARKTPVHFGDDESIIVL
jgi:hypothetical protein